MISYYLSLRLKQFIRFFSLNSVNPVIGIAILSLIFLALSATVFQKISYAPWVYAAIAAAALVELQNNKMNAVLKQQVKREVFFKTKLLENIMLMIPFVSFLLVKQSWIQALLLMILVVPYSYYSFGRPKTKMIALPSPYPKHVFEYNSAFRVYVLAYLLHLLLLVAAVISGNFYVLLVPFFIILFFMQTVYGIPEDASYIWLYRCSSASFLKKKIWALTKAYTLTILPFVLTGLVFYSAHFAMIGLCIAVGYISMIGALFIKYHFYPSAFIIQLSQILFFGSCMVGIAVPPVLLVIILFLLFSYYRAYKNIKYILQC